jgi:hypothetical protein
VVPWFDGRFGSADIVIAGAASKTKSQKLWGEMRLVSKELGYILSLGDPTSSAFP